MRFLLTHTNSILSKSSFSFDRYADIPDGHSFHGVPRYYRHSIHVLQRAIQEWNNHQDLNFVINFGDIVDGKCPPGQSLDAVKKVNYEFQKSNRPVYHMIGNHCLYNLPRDKLLPLLKIPGLNGLAYYDFSPIPEYRIVVLDGYDISAIGWPQGHPKTLQALEFLEKKNPNSDKKQPRRTAGPRQEICDDATKLKQKVIVCCHLPFDDVASDKEALLWNYDEVMNIIHQYNCVKACLSGHDHRGGYSIDSHGVHHRSFEAALECPPDTDAYGHIDVYDDRLLLFGADRMQNTEMYFNS
ncbi:hypothetical protein OIU78_016786 [Salix suchowensis]|nr:hypothetical protein OIU78_016786 [Salix suchowensis]